MRLLLIATCLAAGLVSAAQAQTINNVSAAFNVDVGPVTMMQIKFRVDLSDTSVHSQAVLKSKGITSVFSEYSARAEGQGRIDGAAIEPASFTLDRDKDEGKKRTKVEWQGATVTMDPPAHKRAEVQARIEKALTEEVSDPITAILRVGTAGENPCTTVQRVFDGKEVYDLAFTSIGTDELTRKDVAYRGKVRSCEVTWHAVAGKSAEKGDPDETYGVVFAPAGAMPSGQTLWFPVVLTGKIKGLNFEAYATRLSVNGTP